MKKFLLTMFALLVLGGVNSAKAEKVYADLSALSSSQSTWDGTTHTMTWTATSNNMISNLSYSAGDYSKFTTVVVNISDISNAVGVRLQIRANGIEKTVILNGNATHTKSLTTDFGFTSADLESFEWARFLGSGNGSNETNTINADNPASAKINSVYLEKPNAFVFDAFGKASINKTGLSSTDGLSYDPSTGVLTSDGTAGTLILELENPTDLRNVFHFNVSRSGVDDIISRLRFYDEDNTLINTWNSIKLSNTWNANGIDDNATNAFLNNKPVKKLVWESDANASNSGKTLTINSVEFTLKTIACAKAGETVLNSLPYQKMNGTTETPSWNMNTNTSLYYGSNTGDAAVSYANVTDYSELRIYRDDNTGFRAFFINSDGSNVNIINQGNVASSWNAEKKYWAVDLSKVDKYGEIVALQGVKAEYGWYSDAVKNIVVYQAPVANAPQYILTGSGMQLAETVAALADATATCIDARGVTGITTNSEAGRTLLTSANPNCLFLGTTGNGGLANTQNVITTSGTCDNLVLTDGYPFKAPANFTATAASYATKIDKTAQAGTLCLPFAASIPEGVKAYTLSYTGGDKATAAAVTGTIPANTPVLLNGSGSASFTGANVSVSASPTLTSDAMTGVFEKTAVPQGSYVLQNQDGDDGLGFYQVANANEIYVNPFRAYMTAGSGSKLRIVYDDATAIEDVKTQTEFDGAIYDLQGRKVAQPTKGIYVKNGHKFIVK